MSEYIPDDPLEAAAEAWAAGEFVNPGGVARCEVCSYIADPILGDKDGKCRTWPASPACPRVSAE